MYHLSTFAASTAAANPCSFEAHVLNRLVVPQLGQHNSFLMQHIVDCHGGTIFASGDGGFYGTSNNDESLTAFVDALYDRSGSLTTPLIPFYRLLPACSRPLPIYDNLHGNGQGDTAVPEGQDDYDDDVHDGGEDATTNCTTQKSPYMRLSDLVVPFVEFGPLDGSVEPPPASVLTACQLISEILQENANLRTIVEKYTVIVVSNVSPIAATSSVSWTIYVPHVRMSLESLIILQLSVQSKFRMIPVRVVNDILEPMRIPSPPSPSNSDHFVYEATPCSFASTNPTHASTHPSLSISRDVFLNGLFGVPVSTKRHHSNAALVSYKFSRNQFLSYLASIGPSSVFSTDVDGRVPDPTLHQQQQPPQTIYMPYPTGSMFSSLSEASNIIPRVPLFSVRFCAHCNNTGWSKKCQTLADQSTVKISWISPTCEPKPPSRELFHQLFGAVSSITSKYYSRFEIVRFCWNIARPIVYPRDMLIVERVSVAFGQDELRSLQRKMNTHDVLRSARHAFHRIVHFHHNFKILLDFKSSIHYITSRQTTLRDCRKPASKTATTTATDNQLNGQVLMFEDWFNRHATSMFPVITMIVPTYTYTGLCESIGGGVSTARLTSTLTSNTMSVTSQPIPASYRSNQPQQQTILIDDEDVGSNWWSKSSSSRSYASTPSVASSTNFDFSAPTNFVDEDGFHSFTGRNCIEDANNLSNNKASMVLIAEAWIIPFKGASVPSHSSFHPPPLNRRRSSLYGSHGFYYPIPNFVGNIPKSGCITMRSNGSFLLNSVQPFRLYCIERKDQDSDNYSNDLSRHLSIPVSALKHRPDVAEIQQRFHDGPVDDSVSERDRDKAQHHATIAPLRYHIHWPPVAPISEDMRAIMDRLHVIISSFFETGIESIHYVNPLTATTATTTTTSAYHKHSTVSPFGNDSFATITSNPSSFWKNAAQNPSVVACDGENTATTSSRPNPIQKLESWSLSFDLMFTSANSAVDLTSPRSTIPRASPSDVPTHAFPIFELVGNFVLVSSTSSLNGDDAMLENVSVSSRYTAKLTNIGNDPRILSVIAEVSSVMSAAATSETPNGHDSFRHQPAQSTSMPNWRTFIPKAGIELTGTFLSHYRQQHHLRDPSGSESVISAQWAKLAVHGMGKMCREKRLISSSTSSTTKSGIRPMISPIRTQSCALLQYTWIVDKKLLSSFLDHPLLAQFSYRVQYSVPHVMVHSDSLPDSSNRVSKTASMNSTISHPTVEMHGPPVSGLSNRSIKVSGDPYVNLSRPVRAFYGIPHDGDLSQEARAFQLSRCLPNEAPPTSLCDLLGVLSDLIFLPSIIFQYDSLRVNSDTSAHLDSVSSFPPLPVQASSQQSVHVHASNLPQIVSSSSATSTATPGIKPVATPHSLSTLAKMRNMLQK